MVLVKVARVGGKVAEVAISDGSRVSDALRAAGLYKEDSERVFKNHLDVTDNMNNVSVYTGDSVILEKVKVKLPAGVKEVIDVLVDEDIWDAYEYEDENGDLDYEDFYDNEKEMIDKIISAVRNAR